MILGVIGNGLTIFTLWTDRRKNTATFLFITLAALNTMELVGRFSCFSVEKFCNISKAYFAYVCTVHDNWFWPVNVAYLRPLIYAFHLAGTWNIVLVTACRYVAACYPFKVKQLVSMTKIRIAMVCIIVASVAFYIPRFVAFNVDVTEDQTAYKLTYKDFATDSSFSIWYTTVIHSLLNYAIPFACLAYMTVVLINHLHKNKLRQEQMTSHGKKEDGITSVLVTVVITFMLCELLSPVIRILIVVLPYEVLKGCGNALMYFNGISTLGLLVNASVNFIIYSNLGSFGRSFRRKLRQRLGLSVAVESTTTDFSGDNSDSRNPAQTGSTQHM